MDRIAGALIEMRDAAKSTNIAELQDVDHEETDTVHE